MNKYLRRGLLFIALGVALIFLGYYLRDEAVFKYGWAMIAGTVFFGIGFLSILYSLMRKMDRKALLEERAEKDTD